MRSGSLYDLDEMVLRCRGASGKAYFEEAVNAYRAGAYRSCVISTWIAIYFDLMDKLRALAAAKVETADRWVKDFDKLARDYDPAVFNDTTRKLQEKERRILELCAGDTVGVLRKIEQHELERLREDRNKCAHPTMVDDLEQFAPTAELARTHMRAAIDYVLSKRAIPGRLAAERILAHCRTEYFSSNANEAFDELLSLYPHDMEDDVARQVVAGVLDDLFTIDLTSDKRSQRTAALDAIHRIAGPTTESVLASRFRGLAGEHDPKIWAIAVGTLRRLKWSWDALDDIAQDLVRRVVSKVDINEKWGRSTLEQAIYAPQLLELVAARLPEQPFIYTWLWRDALGMEKYLPLLVDQIQNSASYSDAITLLLHIEQDDDLLHHESALRAILAACASNDQVYGCFEMPTFLRLLLTSLDRQLLPVLRDFKALVHACLSTKTVKLDDRSYLTNELERLVDVATHEVAS